MCMKTATTYSVKVSMDKSEKMQKPIFLCYSSLSYWQLRSCFKVLSHHYFQGPTKETGLSLMVHRLFLALPLLVHIMALTITSGLTGMFSCEVPGGDHPIWKLNNILLIWGPSLDKVRRWRRRKFKNQEENFYYCSQRETDISTVIPTSCTLENLYTPNFDNHSYLNHYTHLIVPKIYDFLKTFIHYVHQITFMKKNRRCVKHVTYFK